MNANPISERITSYYNYTITLNCIIYIENNVLKKNIIVTSLSNNMSNAIVTFFL